MVKDNYGDEPSLQFFETPIVVDNLTGNITKEWDLFIYKQIINVLQVLSMQNYDIALFDSFHY